MRRSIVAAVTAVPVILALSMAAAFAQTPGQMQGGRMMMGQGQGMMMQDPLNLTPEQVARLRELNLDFRRDVIPVQSRLQVARLELQDLVADDAAGDKIDPVIRDISGYQADLLRLATEHRRNVRNILTDEQKSVLDRLGFGLGRGGGLCPGMGMRGGGMMGDPGLNRWACPFRIR